MESWRLLTLVLCSYGVFRELRPLDPFIVKFLSDTPLNFTHDQVFEKVLPLTVYSHWIWLVVLFLLTDMLRYKPVIVLNSITGIVIYALYSFCQSLFAMQVASSLTGLFYACELAYYTYIYAKVDKSHYQEVTGYTQAAGLVGKAISGIVAQAVYLGKVPMFTIAYISLAMMAGATLWSLALPAAERSIYFNRRQSEQIGIDAARIAKLQLGFKIIWDDFISAFRHPNVWKWIFWWTVSDGIYLQVIQLIQLYWDDIYNNNPEKNNLWNGIVDAGSTLAAALCAYLFGLWRVDWSTYGELAVSIFSAFLGTFLMILSFLHKTLPAAYVLYVFFFVFYNSSVTIARSQIASHIKPDNAGLTFGATMLFALLYQSLITSVMTQCFELDISSQFYIFGGMYFGISVLYSAQWIVRMLLRCFRKNE
ncbi:folic acid Hypothetical protein [Nesidiocoris tenuis]|uniref:Thiamine transporter 2 n=1 Tax=Nesidiocoris tenuis TaxID=355587 RepID=A0ABN7AEB7_9HEMI|nr:folic acid Hypothetical protein [Nesidiocoris tenuis]